MSSLKTDLLHPSIRRRGFLKVTAVWVASAWTRHDCGRKGVMLGSIAIYRFITHDGPRGYVTVPHSYRSLRRHSRMYYVKWSWNELPDIPFLYSEHARELRSMECGNES